MVREDFEKYNLGRDPQWGSNFRLIPAWRLQNVLKTKSLTRVLKTNSTISIMASDLCFVLDFFYKVMLLLFWERRKMSALPSPFAVHMNKAQCNMRFLMASSSNQRSYITHLLAPAIPAISGPRDETLPLVLIEGKSEKFKPYHCSLTNYI